MFTAVLKATFLRTTMRFYPISMKLNSLKMIMIKFSIATTKRKMEIV